MKDFTLSANIAQVFEYKTETGDDGLQTAIMRDGLVFYAQSKTGQPMEVTLENLVIESEFAGGDITSEMEPDNDAAVYNFYDKCTDYEYEPRISVE